MKKSLVTLTVGQTLRSDILPLLLEHLPEEQIAYVGLLDGLSAEQIAERYAAVAGEKTFVAPLQNGAQARLSSARVERGLQQRLLELEAEGYETILLLCAAEFDRLQTRKAVLLESERIIPPLVAAIVSDYQVGVMVAVEEQIRPQINKWRNLSKTPCFAVASPYLADDEKLMDAALSLQEQGADVVVLDCIGYHQRHRDFLQKLLGIPVLLSNVLVAKLAAELVV